MFGTTACNLGFRINIIPSRIRNANNTLSALRLSGAPNMVALNDFLAWSDADLLAYLQEHKLPDGSVDMSRIARFEEISGEQRATLGSRFE
jgi:hypothetical protein